MAAALFFKKGVQIASPKNEWLNWTFKTFILQHIENNITPIASIGKNSKALLETILLITKTVPTVFYAPGNIYIR